MISDTVCRYRGSCFVSSRFQEFHTPNPSSRLIVKNARELEWKCDKTNVSGEMMNDVTAARRRHQKKYSPSVVAANAVLMRYKN
jgi:hypothetical protein